MSGSSRRPTIQRVLVTFASADDPRGPLDTAARIAKALEAELSGLFVEDPEVFTVSGHPGVRFVAPWTAPRPVTAEEMERAFRARAAAARERFEETALRWHVRWSFRVARGGWGEQVIAEACVTDLVALDRPRRLPQRAAARVTMRTLAETVRGAVLWIGAAAERQPVCVVYAGHRSALELGDAVARAVDAVLEVIVPETARIAERSDEVRAWMRERGIFATLSCPVGPRSVEGRLRARHPGVVIVDLDDGVGPLDALDPVLEELGATVLVTR
jgi:hypothetical protein